MTEDVATPDQARASAEEPMEAPDLRVPMQAEAETGADAIRHHRLGPMDIVVGPIDALLNWARSNSLWPFGFGLSCCFVEFISMAAANFDLARFGSEVIRPSPRQADVMIVSGTLTKKMAPAVVRLYGQMAEPKYLIAMGNCTVSGGIFTGGYSQVDGIDQILPVDMYVPGCPPRPEALIRGMMELQRRIRREESLVRCVRIRPSISPGTKAAHPWAAPEQILRHLYRRFYERDA